MKESRRGKHLKDFTPEQRREYARLGGLAVLELHGVEHMREMGKKGGKATAEKMGSAYLKEIGRKGGSS